MKSVRGELSQFRPVIITLENEQEASELLNALLESAVINDTEKQVRETLNYALECYSMGPRSNVVN